MFFFLLRQCYYALQLSTEFPVLNDPAIRPLTRKAVHYVSFIPILSYYYARFVLKRSPTPVEQKTLSVIMSLSPFLDALYEHKEFKSSRNRIRLALNQQAINFKTHNSLEGYIKECFFAIQASLSSDEKELFFKQAQAIITNLALSHSLETRQLQRQNLSQLSRAKSYPIKMLIYPLAWTITPSAELALNEFVSLVQVIDDLRDRKDDSARGITTTINLWPADRPDRQGFIQDVIQQCEDAFVASGVARHEVHRLLHRLYIVGAAAVSWRLLVPIMLSNYTRARTLFTRMLLTTSMEVPISRTKSDAGGSRGSVTRPLVRSDSSINLTTSYQNRERNDLSNLQNHSIQHQK